MNIPKLRPGVRIHRHTLHGTVLMAPERIVALDEIAEEIVKSIDGERTVDAIIIKLAAEFDATHEEIGADVNALMQVLQQGGYITL